MMSFFGGGGGGRGWSDEEYEAYVKKLQQEREERYNRMMNEQRLVDSTTDPAQRLALQRRRYKCEDNFVTVSNIPAWVSMAAQLKQKAATAPPEQESNNNNSGGGGGGFWMMRRPTLKFERTDKQARYPVDDELNAKIGLIRGDITSLEVDAIVNAANSSLLGGGGVDGAIHSAAGPLLEEECRGLNGANTGETKITKGFALPARFVLHTVGPIERGDRQLRACYRSSLDLCIKHGIKTVAFCCISTGIYSFPLKRATHIALDETRKFLNSLKNGTYVAGPEASNEPRRSRFSKNDKDDDAEQQQQQQKNNEQEKQEQKEKVPAVQPGLGAIEKIIFCVFTAEELQAYEGLLGSYFPIEGFYAEQYKIPENPEEHDDFNRDDARPEWNPSSASSHSGGSGGGGMGSNITFIGGSK